MPVLLTNVAAWTARQRAWIALFASFAFSFFYYAFAREYQFEHGRFLAPRIQHSLPCVVASSGRWCVRDGARRCASRVRVLCLPMASGERLVHRLSAPRRSIRHLLRMWARPSGKPNVCFGSPVYRPGDGRPFPWSPCRGIPCLAGRLPRSGILREHPRDRRDWPTLVAAHARFRRNDDHILRRRNSYDLRLSMERPTRPNRKSPLTFTRLPYPSVPNA